MYRYVFDLRSFSEGVDVILVGISPYGQSVRLVDICGKGEILVIVVRLVVKHLQGSYLKTNVINGKLGNSVDTYWYIPRWAICEMECLATEVKRLTCELEEAKKEICEKNSMVSVENKNQSIAVFSIKIRQVKNKVYKCIS